MDATVKTFTEALLETEEKVLSGQWGTIGPYMLEAGGKLAALTGAAYGLVCHSFDAAYEAALRTFCKGPGATVLMPAVCVPADALVPKALGFEPVFFRDGTLESLGKALERIRPDAVVLDADGKMSPERAGQICLDAGVPLILNACGTLRREDSPAAYADIAVYSLSEGSEVDALGGGLLVTDKQDLYARAYAIHNCGRPFGADCTLTFDDFVGGDLRVSEWTAAAALTVLETGSYGKPAGPVFRNMAEQPLFRGAARIPD